MKLRGRCSMYLIAISKQLNSSQKYKLTNKVGSHELYQNSLKQRAKNKPRNGAENASEHTFINLLLQIYTFSRVPLTLHAANTSHPHISTERAMYTYAPCSHHLPVTRIIASSREVMGREGDSIDPYTPSPSYRI